MREAAAWLFVFAADVGVWLALPLLIREYAPPLPDEANALFPQIGPLWVYAAILFPYLVTILFACSLLFRIGSLLLRLIVRKATSRVD